MGISEISSAVLESKTRDWWDFTLRGIRKFCALELVGFRALGLVGFCAYGLEGFYGEGLVEFGQGFYQEMG